MRRQNYDPVTFRFADSAVYESSVSGVLGLREPANLELPFDDMQFTSTAHDVGGKVDLSTPVTLDYWGLDLVPKPGASSAGVVSVKTGQIILTAAGVAEPRHFGRPFYLTWGEMLASGELGRLFLDHNSAGQAFDGFPYTPEVVALSDWDPTDTAKVKAHLKTSGTAHFDFFGPDYLNIEDYNNVAMLGALFDGRRIVLAADSQRGTRPTDVTIARDWSGGFGRFGYTIRYDEQDQDGFVGDGSVSLLPVGDGVLGSSVVMSRERICFTVNETARHDFSLGPIVKFGSIRRITGCGCVEGGELERLLLSAELEQAGNGNVLLRSAAYGKLQYGLTPTLSELQVEGKFYVSVVVRGDLEATARARFSADQRARFVDGEIEGIFDTASLLEGLSAEGRLDWHLALLPVGDLYHSLQGRLAVKVLAPIGGAGTEGGLYLGVNAPKSEAWVLQDDDSRFKLNMEPLPSRLTGVYGYVKASRSFNEWIVSGGAEVYAGLGGFELTKRQALDLNARLSGAELDLGLPVALPYVVGNVGVHLWRKILGGVVSAGAWGDLQLIAPYPFGFQGTLGLEGCVAWVACHRADVSCGLKSSEDAFYC